MRIFEAENLIPVVKKMCIEANYHLPQDTKDKIVECSKNETETLPKSIFEKMIENYEIADEGVYPICQDTGVALVFLTIGRDVFIKGNVEDAINEGVRQGYDEGFLRKSVVADPLQRKNTNDNTPAFIYYEYEDGDKIKITFAPKGFGSENMSAIKMLKPSDGEEGVKEFVCETVKKAGANPCPPIVVGVGIGGTFDRCALLAKKALIRDLNSFNENIFYKNMEEELITRINALNIGPQGLSGHTTALKVNIEVAPTHIAGLPVAVNINCHVNRHITEVL